MDSITILKSRDGGVKYPKTIASAVSLNSGGTVENALNTLTNSMTNHNHDDRYYLKQEVQDYIEGRLSELNLSTMYTKNQIDQLLYAKASSTHNHDTTYLKIDDFETRLEQIMSEGESGKFLSKRDAALLYATIDHTHSEYALNIHNHDSIYMPINGAYSKSEVDQMISNHDHNTLYYTKAEIDAMFAALNNTPTTE